MAVTPLVTSSALQPIVGEGKGNPNPLVLDFGCTIQLPGEFWRNTDAHVPPPKHLISMFRGWDSGPGVCFNPFPADSNV